MTTGTAPSTPDPSTPAAIEPPVPTASSVGVRSSPSPRARTSRGSARGTGSKGLSIRYEPLTAVVPDSRNPKQHSLETIRQSFERFGYAEAIVVDDRTGKLVAGHGRLEALLALQDAGEPTPEGIRSRGDAWLVPVQHGWSSKDDAEAAAFMVAANRLTETGGWDDDALAELLKEQDSLLGLGYDERELVESSCRGRMVRRSG